MKIKSYVKVTKQNYIHHEGSCTFDGYVQVYNFAVDIMKNSGTTSVNIYSINHSTERDIEDSFWCQNASVAKISNIHHTITNHDNLTDTDDVVTELQPTSYDLAKIQEMYHAITHLGEAHAHSDS